MKTQVIEIFKNIRKNIVNFVSISVFILLAITLFEGLDFTGNAIKYSADKTFKETNTYDLKVQFGSLISPAKLDDFKEIDGVDEIEPYFTVSDDFEQNGRTYNASITSITSSITKLHIVQGKMPTGENEIAIHEGCSRDLNIKVGDKITFTRNGHTNYLLNTIRNYADYGTIPSGLDSTKNFKTETFTVSAVVLYGDMLNHEPSAHPNDQDSGIPVKAAFFVNYEAFNPLISAERYNGLYLRNNKLKDKRYFNDEYIQETNKLRMHVDEYIKTHINQSSTSSLSLTSCPELTLYVKEYMHEHQLITDDVYANDLLLNTTLVNYCDQLSLSELVYRIGGRSEIIGTVMLGIMSDLFINDRFALGGIFFIVSILICFSVINRLVSADSKLIGTKKALGLSRKEITLTYLSFTFFAVLIAVILGNIGAILIEKVMIPIVLKKSMFVLRYTSYFNIPISLILIGLSVLVTSLITIFACSGVMKRKAIDLLQENDKVIKQKEVNPNKKTRPSKMSLLNRSVIRNFKHDYKRIFATILGISSSVALLIASFGLKFTVQNSFNKQFNNYFDFDTVVYMNKSVESAENNLTSYFTDNNMDYSIIYRDFLTINLDEQETFVGYIYVYEDNASFNRLIHIDPSENNPSFENKGFWLPESYQKKLGCSSDANVQFIDSLGNVANTKITGFYRYYNYQCTIFVDMETFVQTFGFHPKSNSFMINRHRSNLSNFESSISNVEGYLYSYDYYGKSIVDVGIFNTVLTVVYSLYLLATILLSLFVILNLFISNVHEKKKEIITLMINGYSRRKASKYIYLDVIFLTIISLFVGTGLGFLLSWYGQVSIESEFLYFIHSPNILSAIIANPIAITLVIIMAFIALREVKKFKLTNANF